MKRVLFNDNWKVRRLEDSHEYSPLWHDVTLPHDAVIGLPRDRDGVEGTKKAFFPNGMWEYIKAFTAPKDWKGKNVYVIFEGVMSHASVYLNGNYVGGEAYGYSEFSVKLDKYLKYDGQNVLRVACRTGNDSRWYTGGGIYRDVNLVTGNRVHILYNGLKTRTVSVSEESGAAEVEVNCALSGHADSIVFNIIGADGKAVASASVDIDKGTKASCRIEVPGAELWSAEHPNLYKCEAAAMLKGKVTDTDSRTFGIRTLDVSAVGGLKVNGEEVKLRGACIHHDSGILGAKTYIDAEYRRVRKLKEAGFNAIRSAHNPAGRYLLQACDELGMYVMDEAFDIWQISKSAQDFSNDFNSCWKGVIRGMVEKDCNCPSVIMYSIGNEISDLAYPAGCELAGKIAAYTKSLDNTRYTTAAINGMLLIMEKMELEGQLEGRSAKEGGDVNQRMSSLDEAMAMINNSATMDAAIKGGCDAVDIAGYNYMHNRYDPDRTKYPDRIIVGSETYAKYIAGMWGYIENHTNVIGDFTWAGWDYLGETGIGVVSYEERDYHDGFYAGYPCMTAGCGDMDITGFRLPQSYYRETAYGLRNAPYIAVHNPAMEGKREYLSTWGWGDSVSSWSFDGYEGVPLCVDVYGKGEVELFLNGEPVGKADCGPNLAASFTVPYAHGTLEAVSAGGRYALSSADGEDVRLTILAEETGAGPGELVFVNILVTDSEGRVHYGRDMKVSLDVAGGKLIGFGSGAPMTEESYTDDTHTTYRGRAFAVIQAEGFVHVTASASGVESATACVAAKNGIGGSAG